MMKKKGFTLAEVLITLTIIGVVAVVTLPTLMTNTAEQQAKTTLKKMANTMTNSANMAAANLGFDYSAVTSEGDVGAVANDTDTTLMNILRNTVKISSAVRSDTDGPTDVQDLAVYFADGTAIYFEEYAATSTQTATDGHINGFRCVFDTNGKKGPNLISNCQGTTSGFSGFNADSVANCKIKTQKVIRDRFMMRLRNDIVAPIGAASAYILNDDTTSNTADLSGNANYS